MRIEVLKEVKKEPAVFEVIESGAKTEVHLVKTLKTFEEISDAFAAILQSWREKDLFITLRGWRDEVRQLHKY